MWYSLDTQSLSFVNRLADYWWTSKGQTINGVSLVFITSERHLIMGITTTLKVNVNQLAYKYTYAYSKVLITACSTSVVITAITKYLEKKVNIQTFI